MSSNVNSRRSKSEASARSFLIGRLDQKKWYRPTHHQVYMLSELKNNLGPSPDGEIDIVGEGRETSVGPQPRHSLETRS